MWQELVHFGNANVMENVMQHYEVSEILYKSPILYLIFNAEYSKHFKIAKWLRERFYTFQAFTKKLL